MKKVLIAGGVVLVVLLIAAISMVGWQVVLGPKARAVTSRTFERTDARRVRGEYLVENVVGCFHCHSEPDMTSPTAGPIPAKKGAGWQMPIPELGNPYSANITPDPATGIGTWTDDEIARAIQEGVDKNGRALFPIMPYMNFRNFTDEDLASVIVYLRTIPAVSQAVPVPVWPFPLNLLVKTMPLPLAAHEVAPARTTPVARGEYLVKTVAGCGDCHTPADDKGKPLPGMEFGGGAVFHDPSQNLKEVFSVNITPDASGISHYDEAFFIQTLRTGQLPGRTLTPVMPFANFKNMTDDDLKAIFAFLKTLPPITNHVPDPVINEPPGAAAKK